LPKPQFRLADPGFFPVDYSRYGSFKDEGTAGYRFVVTDPIGLKSAVGAGIFPAESALKEDPEFQRLAAAGALIGEPWSIYRSKDRQKAFYAWTQSSVPDGTRVFFTGMILESAGLMPAAVKSYYAALVHFPRAYCWSEDGKFVWYIAPAALAKVQTICRDYPQLGCVLVNASVEVYNGKDLDFNNDRILVRPGRLVVAGGKSNGLIDLKALRIIETRGTGKVQLVKFENGHWQMLVRGKPFFLHGITYHPTPVGLSPSADRHALDRWMFSDVNQNGKIDAPYDAWVDKNRNNHQDKDEPAVGDFKLMRDMGINAIRLIIPTESDSTYNPARLNKPLLRELYSRYGIQTIAVDLAGAYTVGSGAKWEEGTDYTDPIQRQKMKALVRAKVLDLKDEPFLLFWILGNENNMAPGEGGVNATHTNAAANPKAYAEFLNELARMIHALDPDHPVAVGNAGLSLVDAYARYAPEIDLLGINAYLGQDGFGSLWDDAKRMFDRPVFIMEYGCDAYYQGRGEDEDGQKDYLAGNFRDIIFHQAGGPQTGNSIGGIIFQYLDEWWKDNSGWNADQQSVEPQGNYPFPDGHNNEEWFGIAGQGNGKNSPFQRQLRQAYFYFKNTVGERSQKYAY